VDAGTDAGRMMSTERPSKRSDIDGVIDHMTGMMVIFGGDDGPIVDQRPRAEFRGDTWVYEPGFGWSEVTSDPQPSARARYAVAYDRNARRMLMFGGRFRTAGTTGDYTLFNELWAFDFASQSWTMLWDGSGAGPAARYWPALAYDDSTDTLFLAGGGLNANALASNPAGDLWSWDGSAWTEIPTSGAAPSTRLFEGWAHDPVRNLLISFAGQVGDFFTPSFDDLHALDLSTGVWTQLDAGGSGPIGRFNSMLEYDAANDRYLMFGGHADPGVTNDLWAWDAASGGWTELSGGDRFTGAPLGCAGVMNMREIPSDYVTVDETTPERRQGGVFRIYEGTVQMFGGESDCSDHLDDTWTWDLAAGGWTEIIEARSGEACDRRGDDCMCLCL